MSRLPGDAVAEKLMLNHRIEGGCWRWTGAHISTGYGQLDVGGKRKGVHRLAYTAFVGPIPEGMDIDHACNVRDCINPEHLRPMSHRDNILRSAGPPGLNAWKTHCKRGHEFTPENTRIPRPGHRECWTCRRAARREYKASRRRRLADQDSQTRPLPPGSGRAEGDS